MQRIKIFVLISFVALGGGIYLTRTSSSVSAFSESPLMGSLASPTGVIASDNDYANKVGIHWDAIRGATLYRIFRNTTNDSGSATDVGTSQALYFFDVTSAVGQTYFYWVRAENGGNVSALGTPDQGTMAMGKISGSLQPLEPPTAPTANPVTASKAYLGKTLFWDEQMSSTKTVSCGTCHRPAEGGSDPRTVFGDSRSRHPGADNVFGTADDVFGSPGVPQNAADGNYSANAIFGMNEQVTGRKSPSYLNAAYTRGGLFWDGRATDEFRDQITNNVILTEWGGLESQSAGPPLSSAEMAHGGRNWNEVALRIQNVRPLALASNIPIGLKTWIGNRTYPELFLEAFGTSDVTPARISLAIGTHERGLFSDRTPLDRWAAQIEPLTAQEESGRILFEALSCNACHGGALGTDNSYHNIGVRPQNEDPGRGAINGNPDDIGRFKTPTLRNLELHAPFMRNGRFPSVEAVVEFYNRGGDFDAPNIDHALIRQLNMIPQEKADLAAFMKRPFTDQRVKYELPPFDRPQLFTESARVPQLSGVGRAGVAMTVPEAIAIEPPLLGNPNFNIAVKTTIRDGKAVLVIDQYDPGVVTAIPTSATFARVEVPIADSNYGYGFASHNMAIPNDPMLVGQTLYGRWYIQDPRERGRIGVSKLITFTVFRGETDPLRVAPFDFDGDGKTDLSVFRAGEGKWSIKRSSSGDASDTNFGRAGDVLSAVDYDGDGRTDIGVFRNGVWHLKQSSQGLATIQFGVAGDIPQAADYDGDGRADLAVFRPSNSTWYINRTSSGFTAYIYGIGSDKPVAADYDGDGKADLAVYRDGVWFVNGSSSGQTVTQFGLPTDMPVNADFDGDGRRDLVVWRASNGTWYYMRSGDGTFTSARLGISSDLPVAGDYDGDGRTDAAVFRNGVWVIVESSTLAERSATWGVSTDLAIPAPILK